MKDTRAIAILTTFAATLLGAAIAFAGGQGGTSIFGMPTFAFCVGLAFLIQWLAFVPAYINQTERFFDLCGSLTYITVTVVAVLPCPRIDGRSILLLGLVMLWAVRLGTYLVRRIRKSRKDERFDAIKPSFVRFLNAWTLQGLWVSFTLAAALATITSTVRKPLDALALAGLLIWLIGFSIEAFADVQKSRFRADPKNRGRFIHGGLWAWSRHPNYFGEIMLWTGVAVIALPVLRGWQWMTLISPIFVAVLLLRISGVPILEKRADEKWGGQDDYEEYKKHTPVLIPRPPAGFFKRR
jgi:steroid 5-alpha reductase family enzyme